MCFEKPLLWWLFETHVASAYLRDICEVSAGYGLLGSRGEASHRQVHNS